MPRCGLCVSVVELVWKVFTTEAQRSHRDTEIDFLDRLFKRGVNELRLLLKTYPANHVTLFQILKVLSQT